MSDQPLEKVAEHSVTGGKVHVYTYARLGDKRTYEPDPKPVKVKKRGKKR